MSYTINGAIQVIPKSKSKGTYALVDKAIEVIQASGLKYQVTPMETVIEGSYEAVMDVMYKAQQATLDAGAEELLVNIKLHVRKHGNVTFEEKTGKYK